MQRPDGQSVLYPLVKANIVTKICFVVSNSKYSVVALCTEGAKKIKNVGMVLVRRDGEFFEMQSYYIEYAQVKKYIKPYKIIHLNPLEKGLKKNKYKNYGYS